MATTTTNSAKTFHRRKLIVHDDNNNFVELSGYPWTTVTDPTGKVLQQFEGPAEVITTDHAELQKILGEEVVAANTALMAAKATHADEVAKLNSDHAATKSAHADEITKLKAAHAAEVLALNAQGRAMQEKLQSFGNAIASAHSSTFAPPATS